MANTKKTENESISRQLIGKVCDVDGDVMLIRDICGLTVEGVTGGPINNCVKIDSVRDGVAGRLFKVVAPKMTVRVFSSITELPDQKAWISAFTGVPVISNGNPGNWKYYRYKKVSRSVSDFELEEI